MERIKEIVKKDAELFGAILVEFSIHGDNIDAVLYRKNSEISIYDLENITQQIRKDLEIVGLAETYNVNLFSPGLDRVLKGREELDIFEGRSVRFVYNHEGKIFAENGILRGLQGDLVLFETEKGIKTIPFTDLQKVSLFEENLFKRKGGKK